MIEPTTEQVDIARAEALIKPIVNETYGSGIMAEGLAEELAKRLVDPGPYSHDYERSRVNMLMKICWNWMPGGTTAASVANRIEAALAKNEAGPDESDS